MASLISKASLLMVPSTYEPGTLFNVLPSGNRAPDSTDQNSGYDQTRADFDFDRGSNAAATRIDSNGVLQKYRENKLLRSNQFDTTWYNSNSTETGGQADKDGGTNAWLLTKTATNGGIRQNNTTTGVQTFSFYAKAADSNWVKVNNLGSSAYHQANFDLVNGVVGTTDYIIDAKIEDVGNGWFRCITTYNTTLVKIDVRVADSDNVVSGTSGSIYIQSAQLESGLCSTEYLNSTDVTAKAGVLVDLPRINYDANGENGALLLEGSRANGLAHSEYFGSWNLSGGTLTANSTTSPEGVQNAYLYTEDTSTNYHRFNVGASATSSSKVYSIYAKLANGAVNKWLTIDNGPTAWFDLENGVVGTTQGSVVISIESVGNGWYRCIYHNPASNTGGIYIGINSGNGVAGNHTGSGQPAFYAYGAQCEDNATYASSYIPNHGESGGVTRAADVCGGAGDANTFNSTEGVLYAEISALADDGTNRRISLNDGSDTNRINLMFTSTSNEVVCNYKVSGTTQVSLSNVLSDVADTFKIAFKYLSGDFALFVNGVKVDTDSNTTMITANTLDNLDFLDGAGLNNFYGNVKQVLTFNTALTDSELATLTTL